MGGRQRYGGRADGVEERAAEYDEPGSREDAEEDVGGAAVAEVLAGDVQCGAGRIEEQRQVTAPVPLGNVRCSGVREGVQEEDRVSAD